MSLRRSIAWTLVASGVIAGLALMSTPPIRDAHAQAKKLKIGVVFDYTGPLAGGCSGTLTYRGYFAAGASCPTPSPFEARVFGLRGVVRAAGEGITVLAPALLYDRAGNVVGSENPQVLTSGTEEKNLGFINCNSPEGFKEGNFSSVIELFG